MATCENPAGLPSVMASGGADYDLRFAIENQTVDGNFDSAVVSCCQDVWQDRIGENGIGGDELAFTYAELKIPKQAQIDALIALGIEPAAMIRDWRGLWSDIRTSLVEWQGNRFEFSLDGRPALIVKAFDEAGDLIDLCAFDSKGRIGTWLGNASVLGGENVLSPRMADSLTVHKTGFDWLKDYRRGVVIVSPTRARVALECCGPLVAADFGHARELRAMLRHEPRVIVAQNRRAAA